MSEHDETLRRTLEENARLQSKHAESLREASSAQFSGRYRWAERIYWLYAIACVVVGVSVINSFVRSDDTKSLIGCAVVMLVVYETTVLLKLWFAIAGMKMSVLKDVKLLRLEMARLASAAGVKDPVEPPVEYEPMRGASRLERRLWLAACVVAAIATSSWSSHGIEFGGGQLSADSVITLGADGSATSVTDMTQTYHGFHRPQAFPFHVPKECKVRWIDPRGQEMPYKVTPAGTHNRYDVTVSEDVFVGGTMKHTRITETPDAATFEDGVWTYKTDILYSLPQNQLKITVYLPPGAKVVSVEPEPLLEFNQEGRAGLRFQAFRGMNEKFAYTIRYELPSTTDDES
ncbi:MAG: hypothetical protein ISR77_06055 [Pirellulaceae bacterium]|nr:hypothetical protein [Pirellulaceae bacterium]